MSLLELEEALGRRDAVMEPRVERTLREYVAAGGRPANAVQLLSDGYRGAPLCARRDARVRAGAACLRLLRRGGA
jgi:hypothetical protein